VRTAHGSCDVCEESDRLHRSTRIVSRNGRVPMICGLCRDGERDGITDPLELSVWSLVLRRQQERDSV
jgi:hypothetical protein